MRRFLLLGLRGGPRGMFGVLGPLEQSSRHWYFRWGLPVLLTLQLALWFGWEYGAELL